jgi:hypothetical protein
MRKSRVRLLIVSILGVSVLNPISYSFAEPQAKITTCSSLVTKNERILKSGNCISTREAVAHWNILKSDTAIAGQGTTKNIKTCASNSSSSVSYTLIRKSCSKSQIEAIYYRSAGAPAQPVVASMEAMNDSTVVINLAKSDSENLGAPVAYYIVVPNDGAAQKILANSEKLYVTGLKSSTKYSFAITAINLDGTSPVSISLDSVTTREYIAPVLRISTASAPVAQVSLLSNDTAAVTIPAGATSVAVVAPTLGNPSLSFGSQGTAVTATISTASNPVGGSSTPFTVSGSTKIVDINVSGLSGSATVCLDASPTAKLWHYISGAWVDITTSRTSTQVCGLTSSFSPFTAEEQLAAPEFTLSVSSRTGYQDSAITAVTATKTAHAQSVTYTILPSLPTGLSINSSTGTISGTPTTTSSPTDYVVTATNAAAGTATQTLSISIGATLSCAAGGPCTVGATGPGGGTVFYVSAGGFNCGAEWSSTGSPTGGLCHYLETTPSTWSGVSEVTRKWGDRSRNSVIPGVEVVREDTFGAGLDVAKIGLGYKNTLIIAALYSNSSEYAAAKARTSTFGGKTDWYLPNIAELKQMSIGLRLTGDFATAHPFYYWTSTEAIQTNHASRTGYMAWMMGFHNDNGPFYSTYADSGTGSDKVYVRPIRAF